MKAFGKITAAAILVASISSAATAQDCRGLGGWGLYFCLAHNQPDKYLRCNELAIARGYSNMAPGRPGFVMGCMMPARQVALSVRGQRSKQAAH